MSEVNKIYTPLYHNGHLRSAGKEYLALQQELREYAYDSILGQVIKTLPAADNAQATSEKNIDELLTVTH